MFSWDRGTSQPGAHVQRTLTFTCDPLVTAPAPVYTRPATEATSAYPAIPHVRRLVTKILNVTCLPQPLRTLSALLSAQPDNCRCVVCSIPELWHCTEPQPATCSPKVQIGSQRNAECPLAETVRETGKEVRIGSTCSAQSTGGW